MLLGMSDKLTRTATFCTTQIQLATPPLRTHSLYRRRLQWAEVPRPFVGFGAGGGCFRLSTIPPLLSAFGEVSQWADDSQGGSRQQGYQPALGVQAGDLLGLRRGGLRNGQTVS